VKHTELWMRDLALLVAIVSISVEAQALYEAGDEVGPSTSRTERVHQRPTAPAARASYAPTEAATYTNPIWDRDFPDPFILAWEGKYYAYATETRVTGFQVMESRDLVRWTHLGVALEAPWSRKHYWAPEVVAYRGRFYMTYSAENPANRRHDIGIAVADRPQGPFKHAAKLIEAGTGQRGVIDATIFFERDGTPYIIYSEEDPRSIVLRQMAPDLMSVEGDRVELVRPDRAWELGVTEAPTMVYRNGLYHLFYSAGPYQGTRESCRYCVGHAVSRKLTGPYVKSVRPLLETVEGEVYGPGHQCLLRTPNGETWMLYHAWDARNQPRYGSNRAGRTLRMDRLVWEGDEPRVIGPTTTEQPGPNGKPLAVKGRERT
jgi:beta-xylosidase